MIFIETPPKFHWFFCQCKRSLQSRRYYSGFWSRGTWPSAESPDRGPRRNAHDTCTVKDREKSRMRTTYQNISMRFGVFRAWAFLAKKPECYGFFWQCKRYNKEPRFFGFWFLANVNGSNMNLIICNVIECQTRHGEKDCHLSLTVTLFWLMELCTKLQDVAFYFLSERKIDIQ